MRNLSSTEQLILTCTSVLILFTTALTWFASPPLPGTDHRKLPGKT